VEYAKRVNPQLLFFEMSAKTGEGMDTWYVWLHDQLKQQAVSAGL
jgi:hydrogenase nickel incorporation protein HypB